MASDSITSDSKELEKVLRDLNPAVLDPDFLSRLEDAADDTLIALTTAEIQFEKSLRGHAPLALSTDFLSRLETIVSDLPFALDEKIVLFPKTAPVISKKPSNKRYPMWAAAAAVALIGASTALFLPGQKPGSTVAKNTPSITRIKPASNDSHYVAAGFNRVLGDVNDKGVDWNQADKPHRVVAVTYLDRITLKNAEGKTVEVEQPRTEYIFVPEKMD